MSDSPDRRAAQKARTRDRIRTVAHEMFAAAGFEATTIVDISAAAGVSVQTVFNHFASKEELFFSDRARWVEGPAAAVRDRAHGVPVLTALRRHLVASVGDYARALADPCHRRMVELLVHTPTLQTYEMSLHDEAVDELAAALRTADSTTPDDCRCTCTGVLAKVTASVWMAAVRTIVVDLRSEPDTVDEPAVRAAVELLDRVLRGLEAGPAFAPEGAEQLRAG